MISALVKTYLRQNFIASNPDEKLNILVIGATHERYEQQLCKTGHNFYSINHGKTWNKDYGEIPENYNLLIDSIPYYIKPDIVLTHVSGERLKIAVEIAQECNCKVIRHTHTLPESQEELYFFNLQNHDLVHNTFISKYSQDKWGSKGTVIEHGLDLDIFKSYNNERDNQIFSVVNQWASRDWACGWEIYKNIVSSTNYNYTVMGNNPGLSKPAESIEKLVEEYNKHKIFLNTSMNSPVPMSLLEAMACGCAVVSTNTCMIPEVITDGHDGFVCSDIESIKDRLDLLQNNPELVKKIGSNAQKTIMKRFNIDIFCKNWNKIFREVVLK